MREATLPSCRSRTRSAQRRPSQSRTPFQCATWIAAHAAPASPRLCPHEPWTGSSDARCNPGSGARRQTVPRRACVNHGVQHPLGPEPVGARPLGSLGHRYLPAEASSGNSSPRLLHGPALSVHQPGCCGVARPLDMSGLVKSGAKEPGRGAARNVQHVPRPQVRQSLTEGRLHPVRRRLRQPSWPLGSPAPWPAPAGSRAISHTSSRKYPPVLRCTRRSTAVAARHSPTPGQIQLIVYQRPAQRADVGQEHPTLALCHLDQPAAVLPGHYRRFPALLGRHVAPGEHPHRLRASQSGAKYACNRPMTVSSDHSFLGEKALHRPGRDAHRYFNEIHRRCAARSPGPAYA